MAAGLGATTDARAMQRWDEGQTGFDAAGVAVVEAARRADSGRGCGVALRRAGGQVATKARAAAEGEDWQLRKHETHETYRNVSF